MHISKNAAMQIVGEISQLVKQNINLMDETGHIIASCDKSRIGDFHYGAYKIITECLDEYYLKKDDKERGMKQGINLPLELDGEIVGVVGITRSHDEVITAGRLIKKMTEILLMERRVSYHQLMDKRVKNAFFEEWLINDGYKNFDDLRERGKSLGIDIDKPGRIIIVSIDELDEYKDNQEGQSVIAKFENNVAAFLNRNGYKAHFRNASRQIILIDDMTTEKVIEFSNELADYIYEKQKLNLNIGIAGKSDDMHEAYIQAHRAWNAAAAEHEKIICYEDMSLELLVNCIPAKIKLEYITKLFKNSSVDEVKEYMSLLKAYYKEQGSIQAVSDSLYIHKNTLQYRIGKLKELTGYDVRKPSENPALYMAYLIMQDIEMEKSDTYALLHETK